MKIFKGIAYFVLFLSLASGTVWGWGDGGWSNFRSYLDDTTPQLGGDLDLNSNNILASNAAGPSILDEAATSTNPTLNPNRADPDTGIAWISADAGSLAAGAESILQWYEAGTSGNYVLIQGDTLTSGGTDDKTLEVTATLNDSGAAGGSDEYVMLKLAVTSTDVTGWDGTYLIKAMDDSTDMFYVTLAGAGYFAGNVNFGGYATINASDMTASQPGYARSNNPDTGLSVHSTDTGYLIAGGEKIITWTEIAAGNYVIIDGDTYTSIGTSSSLLTLRATINDSGAPGGSDIFRGLLIDITEADKTGADNVYLIDLMVGGSSKFAIEDTITYSAGSETCDGVVPINIGGVTYYFMVSTTDT